MRPTFCDDPRSTRAINGRTELSLPSTRVIPRQGSWVGMKWKTNWLWWANLWKRSDMRTRTCIFLALFCTFFFRPTKHLFLGTVFRYSGRCIRSAVVSERDNSHVFFSISQDKRGVSFKPLSRLTILIYRCYLEAATVEDCFMHK